MVDPLQAKPLLGQAWLLAYTHLITHQIYNLTLIIINEQQPIVIPLEDFFFLSNIHNSNSEKTINEKIKLFSRRYVQYTKKNILLKLNEIE